MKHSSSFLLLVTALGLPACSSADPETKSPPSIPWEDCGGGFECASLVVAINDEAPGEGSFDIPLIRRPAEDPGARIGSLVINPGGPGGSGVGWVRGAFLRLPPDLRQRFDIVGFDPRGVAGSTPALDCMDDLSAFVALDLSPDTPDERQAVIDTTQAFVEGCAQRSSAILEHVGTDSVVRDLDRIREALGDDKLTYLGFSYGTFIGAIYADTFPDHVRALVLDGAVDPALSGEKIIVGQGHGFEDALASFFADCAANPECAFYEAGDPGAAYDALHDAIELEAITDPQTGRALGPGELFWGVTAALYSKSRWPTLASALAAAKAADPAPLLALADGSVGRNKDGSYGDGIEHYEAVFAYDMPVPTDPAVYDALTDEMRMSAPRIGQYFPFSVLPQALWPVPSWRTAAPVRASGAPPIMVVGTTRDPATPYVWSQALASELEAGVLVTRNGDGHTGVGGKSACVDDLVSRYLVDLEVPADGITCD